MGMTQKNIKSRLLTFLFIYKNGFGVKNQFVLIDLKFGFPKTKF